MNNLHVVDTEFSKTIDRLQRRQQAISMFRYIVGKMPDFGHMTLLLSQSIDGSLSW